MLESEQRYCAYTHSFHLAHTSPARPTSRAFILSSEFYDTDIVHVGKNDPDVPGIFIKSTSNPAKLDYDRFWALGIAISAATIGLAAFLGLSPQFRLSS